MIQKLPTGPKEAEPFASDKLDRKQVGRYLSDYLAGKYAVSKSVKKYESFVLNINSDWGLGKTYFLTEWAKQLRKDGYIAIAFDAWQNDFSEQPLIGFMSEIESQLGDQLPSDQKGKTTLRNLVSKGKGLIRIGAPTAAISILKAFSGVDLRNLDFQQLGEQVDVADASTKIAEEIKAQLYEDANNTKKAIYSFKTELGKVIDAIDKSRSKKLPLFIFVDELDRCRPTFSIQLLEDIKHIFGIGGIYFVIATDSTQLGHSIKAVYGEQFDSGAYLRRFFDQEYSLPEPDRLHYSRYLFSEFGLEQENRFFTPLDAQCYPGENLHVRVFALCADFFRLSLRDQEQACAMLDAIRLTSKGALHVGYLTYCVMLRLKHREVFEDVRRGHHNPADLHEQLGKKADQTTSLKQLVVKGQDPYNQRKETEVVPFLQLIKLYADIHNLNEDDIRKRAFTSPNSIQKELCAHLRAAPQERTELIGYPELVHSAEGLLQLMP